MSTAVSTIQSLVGTFPLGLMTAHQWWADHPTDSDPFFGPSGDFTGGDLPFGIIYELHDIPAYFGHDWTQSILFRDPLGKLTNNAQLLGGFGSSLPVEEFFLARPRGLLTFHEPSTTSLDLELRLGVTAKIWGLYIDIPLITPTQMTWTPSSPSPTTNPAVRDGTASSGLTGNGTLTLGPGTIGVRVDVTTIPTDRSQADGATITYWDLGWINWSDGDGFRHREFITGAVWESFPTQPDAARVLAYSLTDGVVATITQLLATSGDYI